MGFPYRLIGAAARLQLRCPRAHRGLSTNANGGIDDWIYWKIFAGSALLTAIGVEGLKMYFRKTSVPIEVSKITNLQVQSGKD
ncbi:unnamed protein product [Urochloa decumbens]|uniref:Uncharacterized protein n=1 Tax=Urochloa decumbens TaxID=240449 RepID=A0ABC9A562_9POAL